MLCLFVVCCHGEQVPCGFGGAEAVGGVGATEVCDDADGGRILEGSRYFSSCGTASCLHDTKSANPQCECIH